MVQLRGKMGTVIDVGIILLTLSLVFSIQYGFMPTNKQGFYCDDPSIRYKYGGDTVSVGFMLCYAYIVPFLIFVPTEICNRWSGSSSYKTLLGDSWRRSLHYYFLCLRGSTFIVFLTISTNVLVGEPRPHFLDSCKPDFTRINCSDGYITNYTCMVDLSGKKMGDLHASFISGHSSLATFLSLFLCFYIYKNISLYPTILTAWMSQAVLLIFAFFCCSSRIMDRRHHWWNVVLGFILGIVCACYVAMKLFERNETEPSRRSQTSLNGSSKLQNHLMQTV